MRKSMNAMIVTSIVDGCFPNIYLLCLALAESRIQTSRESAGNDNLFKHFFTFKNIEQNI